MAPPVAPENVSLDFHLTCWVGGDEQHEITVKVEPYTVLTVKTPSTELTTKW